MLPWLPSITISHNAIAIVNRLPYKLCTSLLLNRNNHSQLFFNIGVRKIFANFTGKHLIFKDANQSFLQRVNHYQCTEYLLFLCQQQIKFQRISEHVKISVAQDISCAIIFICHFTGTYLTLLTLLRSIFPFHTPSKHKKQRLEAATGDAL